MEVSQLDATSLGRIVENSLWSKDLIDEVMKYGRIEESSSVSLSKLKEGEKWQVEGRTSVMFGRIVFHTRMLLPGCATM